MGTASRLCQCHLDENQAPFSVLDQNQFLSFARHSKKGFSSSLYVWIAMNANSGHEHHEGDLILSVQTASLEHDLQSFQCMHSEIHCSVWSRAEYLCVHVCSVCSESLCAKQKVWQSVPSSVSSTLMVGSRVWAGPCLFLLRIIVAIIIIITIIIIAIILWAGPCLFLLRIIVAITIIIIIIIAIISWVILARFCLLSSWWWWWWPWSKAVVLMIMMIAMIMETKSPQNKRILEVDRFTSHHNHVSRN